MYEAVEFSGVQYEKFPELHGYSIYLEDGMERVTREHLYHFLKEQDREWMNSHIGSHPDKHFKLGEGTTHWFEMSYAPGSHVKVLVRQR